jgi:hypothetical protein
MDKNLPDRTEKNLRHHNSRRENECHAMAARMAARTAMVRTALLSCLRSTLKRARSRLVGGGVELPKKITARLDIGQLFHIDTFLTNIKGKCL